MVAPQHAHALRPPRTASPGWGRPGAGGNGGGESRSDVSMGAEGGEVLGGGLLSGDRCVSTKAGKEARSGLYV